MDTKARIILIGCGPHAKRIYLPALQYFEHIELTLVVDLKNQESFVREATKGNTNIEQWFIEPFFDRMPEDFAEKLSNFTQEKSITGVIIATEPLVHRLYAEWALNNGLNILMDKPITTQKNVTSNISNAKGIMEDYIFLLEKYKNLQLKKETIFTINTQRRFHKGFQFVKDQIREIGERTNCPVTFIQAYHCDGQWRLPSEIVTQEYHPYCTGYGKASHSGFHIFDTMYQFYKASGIRDKLADSMEIVSSFVQPNGFFSQLNEDDYVSIFGEKYNSVKKWTDEQLKKICRDYGEVDLSSIITLKKDQNVIANLNVNLLHNGFAGRTWIQPGADLYKGNGRIKHESYHIQQGPFQNIQIHAYQAYDRHDENNGLEDYLGGKNHFDIYIFRNPLVADAKSQPQVYKLPEIISSSEMSSESMITMEWVKYQVVKEFADYLTGKKEKSAIRSQIEDHAVSVQIMSGIYQSHILRKDNLSNIVESAFGLMETHTS